MLSQGNEEGVVGREIIQVKTLLLQLLDDQQTRTCLLETKVKLAILLLFLYVSVPYLHEEKVFYSSHSTDHHSAHTVVV